MMCEFSPIFFLFQLTQKPSQDGIKNYSNIGNRKARYSGGFVVPDPTYVAYTEQDTADKLILPYLQRLHGFPSPASLNYQAQHTLVLRDGRSGRYDGLYLSGGLPYVVLEAKRYAHDLTEEDFFQARSYAVGGMFSTPVPYLIVSNGRQHWFYKRVETIDPTDGQPHYQQISATPWRVIKEERPGEVQQILHERDLIASLVDFKERTYRDLLLEFTDASKGDLSLDMSPRGNYLKTIIEDRKLYLGDKTSGSAKKKYEQSIRNALQAVSLHFTTKILFIKLIEDLSPGTDTPRIIHDLFPRAEYDLIGGLFGYKVLHALSRSEEEAALRLFAKSKQFYSKMKRDIAKVGWQDIFRYGFNVHSQQYGKLFKSPNYDRFLPNDETLGIIHSRLIGIDIRYAVLYGEQASRVNVIGRIYEQLIDNELKSSLGAIYTPDHTIEFMVQLAYQGLGRFRGFKIVEPSCGSGHFYKRLYRRYIEDILPDGNVSDDINIMGAAHEEALNHVFGRDIDPFAVQLTLLGTFLEQLKDNVLPAVVDRSDRIRTWSANRAIDTQNSLDPITIAPDRYFEAGRRTGDLNAARSLLASCERAASPNLIIGNPPYGVSVIPGVHYEDVYALDSKDSYGYFIVNALERVSNGGRVVFIVGSSFLTIKSHEALRYFILTNSKIVRVIKLNRLTFPGIDIFPVVIELEKCDDATERSENFYKFYDLWQVHPTEDSEELALAYEAILNNDSEWPFPRNRSALYIARQGILSSFKRAPIFEGKASLYPFMQDVYLASPPAEVIYLDTQGSSHRLRPNVVRDRLVVKLGDIADVVVGLQSGDNATFYRTARGLTGGAVRGGYSASRLSNVVPSDRLRVLTDDEIENGIEVNDPISDPYLVPLDKAASADIESGLLPMFYQPIDFYVDWSRSAVTSMKSLSGARFQNAKYYFREGISYSSTGLYSPTFRLSHGGVFDQKSPCIFSDVIAPKPLLGILASTLSKYFAKAFINHGVDSQVEELPVVLPTPQEIASLEAIIDRITEQQSLSETYDYRSELVELDELVFDIYGLTKDERDEIGTWYARHYHRLGA
jgi:hypothetical protein